MRPAKRPTRCTPRWSKRELPLSYQRTTESSTSALLAARPSSATTNTDNILDQHLVALDPSLIRGANTLQAGEAIGEIILEVRQVRAIVEGGIRGRIDVGRRGVDVVANRGAIVQRRSRGTYKPAMSPGLAHRKNKRNLGPPQWTSTLADRGAGRRGRR